MNKQEFVKACHEGGYAFSNVAKAYTQIHDKEAYTKDDLIDAYRYAEHARVDTNARFRTTIDACNNHVRTTKHYKLDD